MFYVAEALLDKLGLEYSSHKSVIAAYGQHFAKTQRIDPRFHRVLIQAFETRQLSDYAVWSGVTRASAEPLLSDASAFLAAASEWLANSEQ
jgi:uncharacterized protein (UPF0332 family)